MTTGQVNISNAPRDTDKLQILGPFMLKTLMQSATKELGLDWSEAHKQAFMRDPINKRAEDVLALLQQIDTRGGVQQSAPPPAASPAPASTPAPAAMKREPVTSTTNGTAVNGTNGAAHHAQVPEGVAILMDMSKVLKEVSESQKGVANMLGELNKSIKETSTSKKDIEALSERVEQMTKLQHLCLGVIAQLAEQSLNAPFSDILKQVAEEYDNIEPVVRDLVGGK